ncbi:hypothetical protein [Streptomyces sp. NBC_00358]|uniref:hypothetical protein n=1 Tax=Streptomyces sp. NBC_00358 TaxID=2975725 RepID=UPI002E25B837
MAPVTGVPVVATAAGILAVAGIPAGAAKAAAEVAGATRRTPGGGPVAAVENPVAVTAVVAVVAVAVAVAVATRRTPGAGPVAAGNPAGATAEAAKAAAGAARAASVVPSAYAAV